MQNNYLETSISKTLRNLLLALIILLPASTFAQYSVNFDGSGETKGSYASGSVTLSGISWNFTDALIGNLSNDYYNGVRSARLRGYGSSVISMETDKSNGLGTISFTYRRYGSDAASTYAVEYSTNGGSSWTQAGSDITSPASIMTFSESVNVSGNVRLRIRCTSGGTSNRRMNVEDILMTDYLGSTPSINVSPTSLTGFSTITGTASTSQSYNLSGTNLTPSSGNIAITAPTDFEVSLNNSAFSNSVTVPYSGGSLSSTTVYVRVKSSAGAGTPSGNVTNAGGGATTQNVAVDGTVSAPGSPPSVVVNKYDHNNDIAELLVIDDNLDMRGMVIKDFSSSNDNDNGGKSTFASISLWSSVPAGTLIILRADNSATDVSHADGNYTIDVGTTNSTYFTGSLGAMNQSTNDMVMIKDGTESGTFDNIHTLCAGSAGTQFNAISGGYVQRGGTSSGQVYVNNSSSSLADYDVNTQVLTLSGGLNFGEPNNTTNQTYICSLRGGGNPTPNSNAGGINFTNITPFAITANWTNPGVGGGARRIVVVRETTTSEAVPIDGVDYNESTVFTAPASPNGTTGTGNVVVYDGTGTSVTVTNLAANTNYTFTIYEYNGVDFCTAYRIPGAPVSQSTLAGGNTSVNFELPTSPAVSEGVGTTTLTLDITNPSPTVATTVQVALTGGTGDASDINSYTTQTVTFPANSTADQTLIITVTDDLDFESNETFEFTLQNISGGSGTPIIGVNDQYTLTVNDNDIPNIVINELHYNPNSVQGADQDYEFLELYNAESSTINLSGYTFTQGINYTFPNGTTIDAGEYIIIAINASSYTGNGYDVYQWSSGGLNNSGETVELQTPNGATVDIVTYGTGSPWPDEPDGDGPSLELMTTNLDNSLASNWQASYGGYGTPGAPNSAPIYIYYSSASGDFDDNIWSSTPTGAAGPATIDETISFIIQNGHTVTLTNSGTNVLNLTVESGGTLQASTNNGTPTYFDIFGDILCYGTIGGLTNGLGFDFEGTNQSLTGNGSVTVTRLRKDDSDNTTTNVTIGSDVTCVFGGTCIYNNQPGTILNLTIAAGYTVNVTGSNGGNGSVSIDDLDGISPSTDNGGSLTVNGNLIVSNTLYARSDNNGSYPCSITIGQFGKVTTNDAIVNIDGSSFNGFTIVTGGKFEIGNTLMVQGGTLTSPANLNGGSIIINNNATVLHGVGTTNGGGNISGPVVVKRNGSSSNYNFWSSPVIGQNVGIMGGTVYIYDPSLGTADPCDDQPADPGWVFPGTTMLTGVGYAALGAGNLFFYGNLNDGTLTTSVTTHTSPNVSYNLIGNPYPSAISALDFLTANSGLIQGSIYYWDDDNTGGSGYASNDYAVRTFAGSTAGGGGNTAPLNIASGQGFKVLASSAGNVTFSNTLRNTSNNVFLSQGNNKKVWLSIIDPNNYFNQTLIAFMIDGTEGEDWAYDAEKIRLANSLSLYSFLDDKALAIQGLPELTGDRIVPLGLISGLDTDVTFHIDSTHNMGSNINIILEDRYFNEFHDLRSSDYTFHAGETEYDDRFFLHFNHSVTVDVDENQVDEITIFTYGDMVYINPGSVERRVQFNLMNSLGELILSEERMVSGLTSIKLPQLSAGAYVARVIAGDTVKSEQIFITGQ